MKKIGINTEKQKRWVILDIFICYSRSPLLPSRPIVFPVKHNKVINCIKSSFTLGLGVTSGKPLERTLWKETVEMGVCIPQTPEKFVRHHSFYLRAPSYHYIFPGFSDCFILLPLVSPVMLYPTFLVFLNCPRFVNSSFLSISSDIFQIYPV